MENLTKEEKRLYKLKSVVLSPVSFFLYKKREQFKRKWKQINNFKYKSKWIYLDLGYKTFSVSWQEADYDEGRAHIDFSLGFFFWTTFRKILSPQSQSIILLKVLILFSLFSF
jgi:hypothetical protein